MKFSVFIIFIVIWATFVYDFAAHWTWQIAAPDNYGKNPDYCGFGWTGCLGSLDFAGGTVIHITSGWSGLVIALMLGRRLGYGKIPMEPHNISLVVLGATLLWTGWFGFNAGSAGGSSAKRQQCIRCNANCNRYGGSNLGSDILGTHWKALDSWCNFWRSSWASQLSLPHWICVTNVRTNHRHRSVNCLLRGRLRLRIEGNGMMHLTHGPYTASVALQAL